MRRNARAGAILRGAVTLSIVLIGLPDPNLVVVLISCRPGLVLQCLKRRKRLL